MACDFTRRGGHRALRPGGPQARLGARRRLDRLPAALRRASRTRWRARCCATCGARTRRALLGLVNEVVPVLKVDGQYDPEPAGGDGPLRGRVRPHRLRRVQDRRRGRRRQGGAREGDDRPVRARRGDRAAVHQAPHADARLRLQDGQQRAQAQAAPLGREQHHEPRVARAQHDDRGPRRVSAPSTRGRRTAARWTSSSCASCSPRATPGTTSCCARSRRSSTRRPRRADAPRTRPMDLGLARQGRAGDRRRAAGIGAAIADALAREGCDVAIVDVADAARTAAVRARRSRRRAGRPRAHAADVRDFAPRRARRCADVVAAFGRLDVLVCCAGVTDDALSWKMTEAQWDRVLDVNLKGCFDYAAPRPPRMKDAEARPDRERRLDQRPARQVRAGQLRGVQGRHDRALQDAGARAGQVTASPSTSSRPAWCAPR